MMRQDFQSSSSAGAGECGNCGASAAKAAERLLLHDVRHRGSFRKLCTTCVLRLHSQSFCPTCFAVYHPTPPTRSGQNDAVTCFKCYSSSHLQCVGPNPPNPYTCPLCVSPNSPIFAPRKPRPNADARVIDRGSARILLAAARIAATSMSRAAVAARAEAERRAKEAAFTRKRAREALEHVTALAARERMVMMRSIGNGGSVMIKRGSIGGGNSTGVAVAAPPPPPAVIKNQSVDTSTEVLAALNAVALTGNETLKSVEGRNETVVVAQPPMNRNSVAMDVKESKAVASETVTVSTVQNQDVRDENGKAETLAEFKAGNDQEPRIDSGVVPLPAKENQDQQTRHTLPGEQNISVQN